MWLILLKKYWLQIAIGAAVLSLLGVIKYQNGVIITRDSTIATLTAESKLNEIQKDTLRQAILDQNDGVEKQRINAVQRAKVFKMKSESINDKFERYKQDMSDLNASEECNDIKLLIEGAV